MKNFRIVSAILLRAQYHWASMAQLFRQWRGYCGALITIHLIKTLAISGRSAGDAVIAAVHPDIGKLNLNFINPEISTDKDLTVIVPFFNNADFIDACVKSILSQETAIRFKLILVNDGSTDSSEEILRPYLSDKRITYVSQENRGQSAARNRAINMADGQFMMFVDADDILLPGAIETLFSVQKKTGADIVEGGIHRFHGGGAPIDIPCFRTAFKSFSYGENPRFVLSAFGYSVAKIYRRSLWNDVRFPEGYIFEDIITKFVLRCKASRCVFVNTPVYVYRWNPNSSSRGQDYRKKLDCFWVLDSVLQIRESSGIPMDQTAYLLILNHVGLLNNLIARKFNSDIQEAAVGIGRDFLLKYSKFRPSNMPIAFRKLEEAILAGDVASWNIIADLIRNNSLLKGWREIN